MFWMMLFLDVCWLFFRYGGLAVVDLLVHGCFLLAATVFLLGDRRVCRIPPWLLVLLALPLIVGLIQMISVSPDMLAYLNPVKHRIVNEVAAVYPALEISREITMMPELHRFHFIILVMDVYLAILLLMANRPSRRMVAGFIHGLALTTALLNILASGERLKDLPFLSRFEGTYGALVNPNHFGILSAIFTVFLLSFFFIKLNRILNRMGRPGQRQAVYEDVASIAFTVLCLGLTVISFRAVYSRSGLVALLFMLLILLGFVLWNMFSGIDRRLRLGASVVIVLGILLFFPLGRGIDKFAEKALDNLRVTQFLIGLEYLEEKPWLGVGLGATKSILHPLVPRETVYDLRLSTDFHNEYLQIAVEYGVLGLLAILALLGWLAWRLVPRKHHRSFSSRVLMVAVWCMLVGLAWHSLVSFPLRVTAIRIFAMVMVAFGLKLADAGKVRPCPKKTLLVMMGVLIVALLSLAMGHFPPSRHGSPVVGTSAHKAYRYGSYHQMTKYHANDQLQVVLGYLGDLDGLRAEIVKAKELFHHYLAEQPFSLQALNGLFMLDVIEYRLDNDGFDADQFAAWEARVEGITQLGKNRNFNARLAKFFLYANFIDYLSPSQMTYYETLKTELAFRYRNAEEKAETLAPQ